MVICIGLACSLSKATSGSFTKNMRRKAIPQPKPIVTSEGMGRPIRKFTPTGHRKAEFSSTNFLKLKVSCR